MRNLILTICLAATIPLASAQETKTPPRVSPADAQKHPGETVTVCGKVVETMVGKYGIAQHGKPVMFYIDKPRASQVFYFVTFGSKELGPKEVLDAYTDKNVCVTGKITMSSDRAYIMADNHDNIKVQAADAPKSEAK
ncbi:MAG: hypothetical protein WAL41_05260 [Mycobacterium sp.]